MLLQHAASRRLATYLLLCSGYEAAARPNPQQAPVTETQPVTPVTLAATASGGPVTAVFTPTSYALSGLAPPITAATTITTTDDAGETIAIAIGVGAGIVQGGALAAWLFKPVPGEPPAPTEPPAYPTESQDNSSNPTKDPDGPGPTSEPAAACPFPTKGPGDVFEPASDQPEWTAEIPSQTEGSLSPKCTSTGDNHQLLRAADPAYIKDLVSVFCKSDLSKDQEAILTADDLPDGSLYKNDNRPKETVKFTFSFGSNIDGCADHCQVAYSKLISICQYNSHYLYGSGSLEQGCGTYQLEVGGDPRTKLSCTGNGNDVLKNYMYRDAAMDAIQNFCTAQDGKVLKQGDDSTFVKETSFTLSYADPCGGSGEYKVQKDLCVQYLSQAVDGCDTDTVTYKHGGILADQDNCGTFEFHPTGYDDLGCYPDNANANWITAGDHATVTKAMAEDAINAFCDRSGDGQQYTLDPAVTPSGGFVQDTCKEEGMASCGYFYNNDGTRASDGSLGDISLRITASYWPQDDIQCNPKQKYEIHGDRCKNMLGKLIGDGSAKGCKNDDDSKQDLGSFIESGEKGCILWNAWAVKTH